MTGPLILAGLIIAAVVAWSVHAFVKEHGAHKVLWRFVSGHHLDGHHRTDATWTARGSRPLTPTGHASRWAHRPRLHRAGIRLGVTVAALGALYGVLTARSATVDALMGLAAVLACLAAWRGWRGILAWRHNRRWVRPLHRVLAPVAGHPLALPAGQWLDVPRGYAARHGAQITVHLPPEFEGAKDSRNRVLSVIREKLALEDADAQWKLAGKKPHVVITTSVPPPRKVGYDDIREAIESAGPNKAVLGFGRGRSVVSADLDSDSPHILISAGSGGGKSVLARAIIAPKLAAGDVSMILDPKRISQRAFKGLPNVLYCRSTQEIHDALLMLGPEIERRNEIVDLYADENGDLPEGVNVGPRMWIVVEELNALAGRLIAYWRKIKGPQDPATSPAVEALNEVLFMGRQVRMHVVAIAQMMTAKATGGPEARENFATRCLTRYTFNAWKMLVPEVWPMPPKSAHVGRWQIVKGGVAHETQVAYLTPRQSRELAMSGAMTPFPALERPGESTPALGAGDTPATSTGTRLELVKPLVAATSTPEPVGLADAVARGIVSVSLAAVRTARARDPEFPAPVDKNGTGPTAKALFDPDALKRWERNREKAAGE